MRTLGHKIRELKDLADDDALDADEAEFVTLVAELTGDGRAPTLLTEGQAGRIDEIYESRHVNG
jgi:hypothetical protein